MEGKEREERGIGGEGKMNLFGLSVRKRGEGVSNVVEDGVRRGGGSGGQGEGGKGGEERIIVVRERRGSKSS